MSRSPIKRAVKVKAPVEVESSEKDDETAEADRFRALVYQTRNSKNKFEVDDAFLQISELLGPKIKRMAGRYKIPGNSFEDVFQECLIALRYKAIKDYDETKGSTEGPALFDRFAMMCIRRHLATAWKTANQNKKRILNESKSLDQDRSSTNDDLSLSNIICSDEPPTLDRLEIREFVTNFVHKLVQKLSKFEKEVFFYYVKKYSYEEVAEKVLGTVDQRAIKAIDNGLSRIKHKGRDIAQRMIFQNQAPKTAIEILKKHFGDDIIIPPDEDDLPKK
jgi:RNA polymerase sporulation-specific sigma factor